MPEPITVTVAAITGLVGLYKAYTEYKAALAKAEAEKAPKPAQSAEAAKGEQAAPIIKAGVQQYGEAKDLKALQNFEDEPEDYQEAMQKMLERVAARSQPFAQQLQTLAQQANIQTGGSQGSINVSGHGSIKGQVAAVNDGTMTGTFNFNDDDKG